MSYSWSRQWGAPPGSYVGIHYHEEWDYDQGPQAPRRGQGGLPFDSGPRPPPRNGYPSGGHLRDGYEGTYPNPPPPRRQKTQRDDYSDHGRRSGFRNPLRSLDGFRDGGRRLLRRQGPPPSRSAYFNERERRPYGASLRPPPQKRSASRATAADDYSGGPPPSPAREGSRRRSFGFHRSSSQPPPAAPSIFSERERRPYGGVLQGPPLDASTTRGRIVRSNSYDEVHSSSSAPGSRRSSGVRGSSLSSPPPRSSLAATRGSSIRSDRLDDFQSNSDAGRRRSFGFRTGSPPPIPESRNYRSDGYDGPVPPRERREDGSGRWRVQRRPPMTPIYDPAPRPSRSERFESRFISPVRRRFDRFSFGPTDPDRLLRSYPSASDYPRDHRQQSYRDVDHSDPHSSRTSAILDIDGRSVHRDHRRAPPVPNFNERVSYEGSSLLSVEEMRARLDRLRS